VLSGARARQKRSGDNESPWNIPLLMLIRLHFRDPLLWFRWRVVFHFFILALMKLTTVGLILNISRHLIIHERGTLSNAFL